MNIKESKASASEVFNVALTSNINFHNNFVGNSFKLAALLTVVIGWVISSQAARDFLNSTHLYLWIAILAFTVFSAVVSFLNFKKARAISDKLHGNLLSLKYMDQHYFEHYKISSRLYFSMLLLIMVLFAILIAALSYIRG